MPQAVKKKEKESLNLGERFTTLKEALQRMRRKPKKKKAKKKTPKQGTFLERRRKIKEEAERKRNK